MVLFLSYCIWDKNIYPLLKCQLYRGRTVEKGGRGGERSRAHILCHEILLLLYIFAVHLYDNLSALTVYLQEPSTLMAHSCRKPNRHIDTSNLSKLVLSQRVSRWCRRVFEFPFTSNLFGH